MEACSASPTFGRPPETRCRRPAYSCTGHGSVRIAVLSAFEETSKQTPQKIWDGVAGRAIHGERLTLGLIELDPGSIVPEHSHENEQLGIMIAGSVEFRVGDETRELRPGDTWSIPANTPHEVHTGPDGAIMIDVFAPVREDWKPLERFDRDSLWP